MSGYILSIDQGTTSSRAIIFDGDMKMAGSAQAEITQYYPQPGWVEHDAAEIWRSVVDTVRKAIADAGIDAADIAAIGITNQRETAVVWDRGSGKPLHRAIVWQDRRTAEMCESLKADGYEKLFSAKTGLLLDPISPERSCAGCSIMSMACVRRQRLAMSASARSTAG